VRALFFTLVFTALTAVPVLADAELLEATPAAGSVVMEVPDEVRLVFDEPLDAAKSSVEVRDPGGAKIAEGTVLTEDPDTIAANLPTLEPGAYEVRWTAGSTDGHLLRDTYTFTVEAAPSPTLTTTPEPTASAGTPASTAPTLSPSPAPPEPVPAAETGADVLIPIVAGLLLVGGFGLYFLRRRRA
jgi:LPXTG-motif cell wall-anchored protein